MAASPPLSTLAARIDISRPGRCPHYPRSPESLAGGGVVKSSCGALQRLALQDRWGSTCVFQRATDPGALLPLPLFKRTFPSLQGGSPPPAFFLLSLAQQLAAVSIRRRRYKQRFFLFFFLLCSNFSRWLRRATLDVKSLPYFHPLTLSQTHASQLWAFRFNKVTLAHPVCASEDGAHMMAAACFLRKLSCTSCVRIREGPGLGASMEGVYTV